MTNKLNLTLPATADLTFPNGDFTCKDFLTMNGVDIVRITQIKAQRKLNALAAKGSIYKNPVKNGLETVYCLVSEDTKVNGSATIPETTPIKYYSADDVAQDGLTFPVVTFGYPTTIRVGGEDAVAADGSIIAVTKEQMYKSSARCRYSITIDSKPAYASAYSVKSVTELVIQAFQSCEN